LTLLSAVAGATVISQLLPLSDRAQLVVIVVLSALGVVVQRKMVAGKEKKRTAKEPPAKGSPSHLEERPPEDPQAQ
jgi:membrane protein implicated in regulation of membrane protease activity